MFTEYKTLYPKNLAAGQRQLTRLVDSLKLYDIQKPSYNKKFSADLIADNEGGFMLIVSKWAEIDPEQIHRLIEKIESKVYLKGLANYFKIEYGLADDPVQKIQ